MKLFLSKKLSEKIAAQPQLRALLNQAYLAIQVGFMDDEPILQDIHKIKVKNQVLYIFHLNKTLRLIFFFSADANNEKTVIFANIVGLGDLEKIFYKLNK